MTKVVSLSDEAYEELSKLKANRSFSKIVLELVREKQTSNLMKFAGILTKEEGKRIKKIIYIQKNNY